MTTLAAATADVARQLAPVHLTEVAAAYREHPRYSGTAVAVVSGVLPGPHRPIVSGLNEVWASEPDTPGVALAAGLEAAAAMEQTSERTAVEVVVTGPNSPAFM